MRQIDEPIRNRTVLLLGRKRIDGRGKHEEEEDDTKCEIRGACLEASVAAVTERLPPIEHSKCSSAGVKVEVVEVVDVVDVVLEVVVVILTTANLA